MRKKVNKKLIVALLSFVLLFGGTFASSLAWLLDTSDDVQNTFSTSDINITLTESTNLDLKMIPGHKVTKDPHVGVLAGSEDCWLFVEITEELGAWKDNVKVAGENPKFKDYLNYTLENGWEQLEQYPNVYCRKVTDAEDTARKFQVLKDNTVQIDGSVTKEMMEEIDGYADAVTMMPAPEELKDRPTLTFKAYATQLMKDNEKEFTSLEAWELVKNLGN